MNATDRRKGIWAASKKWSPTTRFMIYLAAFGIVLAVLLFKASSCSTQKEHKEILNSTQKGYKEALEVNKILQTKKGNDQKLQRPYLIIQITSLKLLLDKEGKSLLPYILINNGGMPAYDIRKGHRIFNEKKECLKYYYNTSDQYLLDLVPGEKSPIHTDNLEKLVIEGNELDKKFFKLQLIITYKKSNDENDMLYYSLANLVLIPINCKEGYCNEFIITRPSTKIGSIDKFINECKEFNGK